MSGGTGTSTAASEPGTSGVVGPHAPVKSDSWFGPGGLFTWWSTLVPPFPRQVAASATRRMSSVPSGLTPTLDRADAGGLTTTLSRMRTPLGRPLAHSQKSPFTPTIVPSGARRRCIEVTRSVPTTVSFDRTGFSA